MKLQENVMNFISFYLTYQVYDTVCNRCPKCKIKFDSYDEIVEHLENRQARCRAVGAQTNIDERLYWTAQTSIEIPALDQKHSSYHSLDGHADSDLMLCGTNQRWVIFRPTVFRKQQT